MMTRSIKIKNGATIRGRFKIRTFKAGTKELIRETPFMENLIVLNNGNGLNIVIQNLLGTTSTSLEITQAKIGTGDTAPNNNDVDLETTILDGIQIANRTQSSTGTASLEFFIADAELAEGIYSEFGIFAGNKLFARSLISPVYTKSVGEDSQVEYQITFSNV